MILSKALPTGTITN